jgi:hypothetical protein
MTSLLTSKKLVSGKHGERPASREKTSPALFASRVLLCKELDLPRMSAEEARDFWALDPSIRRRVAALPQRLTHGWH